MSDICVDNNFCHNFLRSKGALGRGALVREAAPRARGAVAPEAAAATLQQQPATAQR